MTKIGHDFESIDEIPYDTVHDGQSGGSIILLENEHADLLFSERDRQAAAQAITEHSVDVSLFERLNRLYTEGNSIQAKYFLSQLAELELVKAEYTYLGNAAIEQTIDDLSKRGVEDVYGAIENE